MRYTCKQLAGQAEIKLGCLTGKTWTEKNVRAVLALYPDEAVRHLMREHMKFAGIFRAGHQLADWCYSELRDRELKQAPQCILRTGERSCDTW